MCGVKLDIFHNDPGFGDVSSEWTAFDVDVGSSFACLIGTDITIYLGSRRSQLWLAGSHDAQLEEEVRWLQYIQDVL